MEKVLKVTATAVVFVICCGSGYGVEVKKSYNDLTGPWQLFVDDYVVAEKSNVERSYHAFEKYEGNPVMVATEPWEGSIAYSGNVIPQEDGSGYRMYYGTYNRGLKRYLSLYATSEDGIQWEKPTLGMVEFKGSKANNLYVDSGGGNIIHTPWSEADKRYKMMGYDYGRRPPVRTVSGYYGSYSSDGLHWTEYADNPVLPDRGDVGVFNWDAHEQRYIGYPKVFSPVRGYSRRCCGFSTTRDMSEWPSSELMMVPDEYDDRWVRKDRQHTDFYRLSGFAYESMYIGFLQLFRITDGKNEGPLFVELVSSGDGVNWIRQERPRPAILPCGPEGAWDGGMVSANQFPLVEGDTIKLWYSGMNIKHGGDVSKAAYSMGLATLRKDGFASLDARGEVGEVLTRPLKNVEGELYVNAEASGGWLKAEILDADGDVVEGYSRDNCEAVKSDGVKQLVSFAGKKSLPSGGGLVRIRFIMKDACLYSFMAGEDVERVYEPPVMEAYYTFEGDSGKSATDKAISDGVQEVRFNNGVKVVSDRDNAASGPKALELNEKKGDKLNTFEIKDSTNLGMEFTLACNVKAKKEKLMRIFSTYRGVGRYVSGELILDFNPSSGTIRFVSTGQQVRSENNAFGDGEYHHYAVTYDRGKVKIYLDGEEVGKGEIRAGSISPYDVNKIKEYLSPAGVETNVGIRLACNLRIGNDEGDRFIVGAWRKPINFSPMCQLCGFVDDVYVAKKVLSAGEIKKLARSEITR